VGLGTGGIVLQSCGWFIFSTNSGSRQLSALTDRQTDRERDRLARTERKQCGFKNWEKANEKTRKDKEGEQIESRGKTSGLLFFLLMNALGCNNTLD